MPAGASTCIEWGWASRALEHESGDLHVVAPFEGGALLALIDGLGHGPEAALAARAAVPVIEQGTALAIDEIIRGCHAAMRRTRGAAMSIVAIDSAASMLSWIGIGNVDAIVLRVAAGSDRPVEALMTRGGVVGFALPPLRPHTISIAWGDTIILATDGVRGGFTAGVPMGGSPAEIADAILARHAKGTDDAHVLVARYLGETR